MTVLNQNGSGFWGDILAGWHYVTFDLASLRPMVVSMSLGGGASPALQAIMQAATDAAYSRGVLMVASAGNSGCGGQGVPARLLEATTRPWSEPLSPADAPHQQFEPLRGASTAYWANVWEVGAGHLDADAALDAARGGKRRGRSGR